MTTREFSHLVPLARLSAHAHDYHLVAGVEARAALARRFDLLALERLEATLAATRTAAGAHVAGRLVADVVQRCVVSAEPVPAHVEEELDLRFEPQAEGAHDIELAEEALDTLPVEGDSIDLGEAVAQSLALALEPYPRAAPEVLAEVRHHLMTEAEAEALAEADKRAASPFARLRPE